MDSGFRLFGPVHLAVIATIVAVPVLLALLARRNATLVHPIRYGLALGLLGNELAWYLHVLELGWVGFPDGLPLQLSDVTFWLAIVVALTLRPALFDIVYYWALAGASLTVITPELWEPFPSRATIQFFVMHGGVVATILYLILVGLARPRPGSMRLSFLVLLVFTSFVGAFNAVFGTNYMFLREKPVSPTLLDYMGPWPVYIGTAGALGALLFWLLWLPFRPKRDQLIPASRL
ncbi:MAG: TIGR02206 family membrane protein [Bryobacteraceae bacterium]